MLAGHCFLVAPTLRQVSSPILLPCLRKMQPAAAGTLTFSSARLRRSNNPKKASFAPHSSRLGGEGRGDRGNGSQLTGDILLQICCRYSGDKGHGQLLIEIREKSSSAPKILDDRGPEFTAPTAL
jgi:hypothetical protein